MSANLCSRGATQRRGARSRSSLRLLTFLSLVVACAFLALPTAALADGARSSQYAGGGTARDFDCNDFSSQNDAQRVLNSVSYTHLTLPTIYSV